MNRVELTWHDASSSDRAFSKKQAVNAKPYILKSMGYLVGETDKEVIIALEYCKQADTFRHLQFIPRKMIMRRVKK